MTDPIHAVHHTDNDGMTTACGLTWLRWSEPKIKATAQWEDVTCDECIEAMRNPVEQRHG